jgi:hypothetical protein
MSLLGLRKKNVTVIMRGGQVTGKLNRNKTVYIVNKTRFTVQHVASIKDNIITLSDKYIF